MTATSILVVGACQAGVQLVASLREGGHTGRLVLVGAEPYLPYQRPPLSKAYLSGEATADSLALRASSWYEAQDIELVLGERVVHVDLDGARAQTDAGRDLDCDRVALTTGARVRRLAVPGADLPGVLYLRDLAHAEALAAALPSSARVVVVGGGFIGLEAAAVCRGKGKQVTVVEFADRLMARAVAPIVSDFYRDAHVRRGTTVLLGRGVVAIDGVDRATGVVLDNGVVLPADLVLVGVGVHPRVELAESMGITVEQGAVRVDEHAQTSDARVVAAGDVCLLPNPRAPEVLVRLESVQNAVDQAKTAAATLLGQPVPYQALPWFWSDQAGIRLQIAGLSMGWQEAVLRGSPDDEAFSVLYLRNGHLLAVDAVNRPADFMAARRALSRGPVPMSAAAAGEQGRPLKELLAAASV